MQAGAFGTEILNSRCTGRRERQAGSAEGEIGAIGRDKVLNQSVKFFRDRGDLDKSKKMSYWERK